MKNFLNNKFNLIIILLIAIVLGFGCNVFATEYTNLNSNTIDVPDFSSFLDDRFNYYILCVANGNTRLFITHKSSSSYNFNGITAYKPYYDISNNKIWVPDDTKYYQLENNSWVYKGTTVDIMYISSSSQLYSTNFDIISNNGEVFFSSSSTGAGSGNTGDNTDPSGAGNEGGNEGNTSGDNQDLSNISSTLRSIYDSDLESGKILKERVENFLNNGGTLDQFVLLYVENGEGSSDDFLNEYTSQVLNEGTIFDKIGRGIENIWKSIISFFTNFGSFIGNIINAICNAVTSICEAIGNIVSGIVNGILNGLGAILKTLFVPEHNPFEDLSQKINEKFGFVGQIKELITSLLGFNNYGNSVPSFTFTYFNTTVAIIDFSLFLQYRDWIHGIILAIAWTIFVLKTYKKLPNIIGV